MDVDPDRVLVTPGSTMGIYMVLRGLVGPENGLVTFVPCARDCTRLDLIFHDHFRKNMKENLKNIYKKREKICVKSESLL